MHRTDMESLAGRIASLQFAVVLLAEMMEVQGLVTRTWICDTMRTAATGPSRAATVAKALSAISQRVEELEERATQERRPVIHVLRPNRRANPKPFDEPFPNPQEGLPAGNAAQGDRVRRQV